MKDFGIGQLCIAPIRSAATDKAEMVSQLLFGELIEILAKNKQWIEVKCLHDGYKGWMDSKQIIKLSLAEAKKFKEYKKHFALNLIEDASNHKSAFKVLLGSVLYNYDGLNFESAFGKMIYSGQVLTSDPSHFQHLDKIVLKYLHTPYLWGGRSAFGIDCSGFVQLVFRFFGVYLKRDAWQQATEGRTITLMQKSVKGDLAYFGDEERITHVGIILDNQQIIHASGEVRIDQIDQQGIYNRDQKKYTHKLKLIKRLLPA